MADKSKTPANASTYQRRVGANSPEIRDDLPDAFGLSEAGDFAEATYLGLHAGKARGKDRILVQLAGPGIIHGTDKSKKRGDHVLAEGEVVVLWAPHQVAKKLERVAVNSTVAITRTAEMLNLSRKGEPIKPGDRTMGVYTVQVA